MNGPGWSLLLVLLYLPIAAFAPGFFIVRRWRLSPTEKITASAAISIFLLYLVGFLGAGLLGTRVPAQIWAAVCVVLALLAARDWRALVRHPIAGATLKAAGCVVLFSLVLTAILIIPTGGNWEVDLWEHYQRTAVFMGMKPIDEPLINYYHMAARPPLMNAAAAAVMTLVPAKDFCVYQLVFACLSATAFLGAAALAPRLRRAARPAPWLLASLLVCVPMFWQNCTFPWTKLLAAFFVLASLSFYLAGLHKNSTPRKALAFGCAAAAILTHYSAAPYVFALVLHYVFVHSRTGATARKEFPRALALLALSLALLASWFAYSIYHFGAHATFASNTTATGFSQQAGLAEKSLATLKNFYHSFVPFFLRGVPSLEQANPFGQARDVAFLFYQTTLPGIIGPASLLTLLLAGLATSRVRAAGHAVDAPAPFSPGRFWVWLVPAVIVVGIAVHPPDESPFGVAHVCLIPLALVAVAAAAQSIQLLSPRARLLVGLFCLADFLLGVALHYYTQSIDLPRKFVEGRVLFLRPWAFASSSMLNLETKYSRGLRTLHDSFDGFKTPLLMVMCLAGLVAICYLARGWRRRAVG